MTARLYDNIMNAKARAKKTFVRRTKNILGRAREDKDPERWHGLMEDILINYLSEIGCRDVVSMYKNAVRELDR